MRKYLIPWLAVIGIAVILTGCASLQSGADPLVVRTEQTLTVGKSTFDLVVTTDNANRELWKAKAPAFHAFAEYLRQSITIDAQSLPRGAAWLYSLNVTKQAYKRGAASKDALVTALAVVETGVAQAQQHITQTKGIK